MLGARALAGATLLVAWLPVSVALANGAIAEARGLLEGAEFEQALDALDHSAADGGELDRDEVVELLELRAMACVALERTDDLRAAVLALATLAPDHRFRPEAPPELQELLAEVRAGLDGPLAVEADVHPVGGGVRIGIRLRGDAASLVSAQRAWVRDSAGRWTLVPGGGHVAADGPVTYYAEAIGPGGAVLATDGTRDTPRRFGPMTTSAPPDADSGGFPWAWVVVGTVVVALAAGAVAFLLSWSPGDAAGQGVDTPVLMGF